DGKGGVKSTPPETLLAGAPSGVHVGSPSVSGLPSPAPVGPVPGSDSRRPVIGRQKSQWYFDSQIAMPASAIARFTSASSRAVSSASERMRRAIVVVIWLYRRGGAHRLGVPS